MITGRATVVRARYRSETAKSRPTIHEIAPKPGQNFDKIGRKDRDPVTHGWWPTMDATPDNPPAYYRIGDLVLDTGARRVSRGRTNLKLAGLTYDLLLALAQAAPSMLSYDALAQKIWQGRPVTPETIAQRAKMLRDALSDDARSPRYLELIRGQGYRLLTDVEIIDAPASGKRQTRWWPWAAAAAAVLAAVLGGVLINDVEQARSVAVLPFTDMSPLGDQRYLADGVAEEVINHLAALDGLDVASRTESFFYRDEGRDLQKIGQALNVSTLLEGSVRKSADEIRVTVQLIDVDSGFHLWTENFDRRLEDIFQIQDEIAAEVAGVLGVQLGVGAINQFPGAGTRDIDAYEAFLKRDFAKAIELDPNYAAAWAAEGLRIAGTMWRNMPREAPEIIKGAFYHTETALRLNPQSAQAHADFATMNYATMDWARSEAAYRRAMELNRGPYVLGHYANMMMRTGRTSLAQQIHDERDSMVRVPFRTTLLRMNVDIASNDFVAARTRLAKVNDADRPYEGLIITVNDGSVGDLQKAIDGLPTNSRLYQELFGPVRDLLHTPDAALLFLRNLLVDPAREWPSKYNDIALLAAFLDSPELALEALVEEVPYTAVRFGTLWYPVMADVRRTDGFKKVVDDLNLVDYWREFGWADFCRPVGDKDFTCQ